jgi:DNA invertase Pin-like site-specific DNA recombinase
MGNFLAYVRVSTPRQGEKGVSLPEQKAAIERYAALHGLEIARWFEERESASHQGRPAFTEMLRLLNRGTVQGVIIHKIDRSARNLEDWADIGKLVDLGVEVHFATENIDLRTVAGRLSADIQAVVAAHYSRNLREEVKKGLYGRLKQGFYPFRAPLGYLDQGSAKPKVPDPMSAPLIRDAFRIYGTGQFSLPRLAQEMYDRGLRNRNRTEVTVNGVATMLRNPFYVGLMRICKTGETFAGNHEPLVSTGLFEAVQMLLDGKRVDRKNRTVFRFSRIVRCKSCSYSLIAERQKGHVYYRCHNRPFKNPPVCPLTSVREEELDEAIIGCLAEVDLSDDELALARSVLARKRNEQENERAAALQALQLQRDQLEGRLTKLVDLLADGTLDKALYASKQDALLMERARIQERVAEIRQGADRALQSLQETVELAKSPSTLYKTASPEKKRELVKTMLSNLTASGRNIDATLALPFRLIAERSKTPNGGPQRGGCRTWDTTVQQLFEHFSNTTLRR